MSNHAILEVKNLIVNFDVSSEGDMPWTKAKKLQAVNDISFSLHAGETLGIVGESGWENQHLLELSSKWCLLNLERLFGWVRTYWV